MKQHFVFYSSLKKKKLYRKNSLTQKQMIPSPWWCMLYRTKHLTEFNLCCVRSGWMKWFKVGLCLIMLIILLLYILLGAMGTAFNSEWKAALLKGAPLRLICSPKLISHKSERQSLECACGETGQRNYSKYPSRERDKQWGMNEWRDLPIFFGVLMKPHCTRGFGNVARLPSLPMTHTDLKMKGEYERQRKRGRAVMFNQNEVLSAGHLSSEVE